ncbi:MAG: DUF4328 domain-containing protein [Mucilaginibacter polytrichastri]|nr:DUF4328 domain-containing protein [Mucilaginibacter polytrichastri]
MRELLSNRRRSDAAIFVFRLLCAVSIFSLISDVMQYNLLTDPAGLTITDARNNDLRQRLTAGLYFILFIVSIVFFIRWFRRAYANLHRIQAPGLRFGEKAAVYFWFIPFLLLIRPFQIMREIWYETQRNTQGSTAPEGGRFITWWWAMWLLRSIAGQIAFRMADDAHSAQELTRLTLLEIAVDLIDIPTLFLAMHVVRKVSYAEAALDDQFVSSVAYEPGVDLFTAAIQKDAVPDFQG